LYNPDNEFIDDTIKPNTKPRKNKKRNLNPQSTENINSPTTN